MRKNKQMNEQIDKQLEVVSSKAKFGKGIVTLALIGIGSSLMAKEGNVLATAGDTNDGSFSQLLGVFNDWMTGSLGKLLALLGFIGTFLIYLMTHHIYPVINVPIA